MIAVALFLTTIVCCFIVDQYFACVDKIQYEEWQKQKKFEDELYLKKREERREQAKIDGDRFLKQWQEKHYKSDIQEIFNSSDLNA